MQYRIVYLEQQDGALHHVADKRPAGQRQLELLDNAHGHTLAVQQPRKLGALDGVPDGVPEVQDGAKVRFTMV